MPHYSPLYRLIYEIMKYSLFQYLQDIFVFKILTLKNGICKNTVLAKV